MPFLPRLLVYFVLIISLARADDASDHRDYLNGGYFLLHKVAADEDQVPLLLDIKHSSPEVVQFADRVSKTGKETMAEIESLQAKHPPLHFDKNHLPLLEQDTRASIKDDKQKQLLFDTTGPEFIRAFLISQIEASTYALNLAKVLGDSEKNPDTVRGLNHISAQWLQRRNEAFQILRNY